MPFTEMPQVLPDIDPDSEWAWGLMSAFFSAPGSGINPVIDLRRPSIASTPCVTFTNSSLIRGTGKSSWNFPAGEYNHLNLTTGFTVGAWFESPSTSVGSGYPSLLDRGTYASESANTGWSLGMRNSTDSRPGYCFALFNNNAGTTYGDCNYNTVAAGTRLLVGTTDGTTRRLYLDGVEVKNTTNGPTCASNTTGGVQNSPDTASMPLYEGRVYNRALTAAQVYDWWLNPWSLYRVSRRKAWLFVAAAAAGGATPKNVFGKMLSGPFGGAI